MSLADIHENRRIFSNFDSLDNLVVLLDASDFKFGDPNVRHLATEWNISKKPDFSTMAFYLRTNRKLKKLWTPLHLLDGNTTYYWRVRFYGSNETVSPWSDIFSFTTTERTGDVNGDGIFDQLESPLLDMNENGIYDIEEDDIKSFITHTGLGRLGIFLDKSVGYIESVNSIDPDIVSRIFRPHSMPLGLTVTRLKIHSGDKADIKIYFSRAAPENASWLTFNTTRGWSDYSEKVTFSKDRKSAVIRFEDGGSEDADGLKNGVIIDPGGFGLATWVEGRVYDGNTQEGISQANITIQEDTVQTDSEGYYVTPVLPGTYTVTVSADGYASRNMENVQISEGEIVTQNIGLMSSSAIKQPDTGYLATETIWIRAVIDSVEKGPIDAVWELGGESTTSRGDRCIWGYFYAAPDDVTWGSISNPDLFVKIWLDAGGRIDVNYFHVSVPDIIVYSDYPYDETADQQGTTTIDRRYIRQYYENGSSYSEDTYEDGNPPDGYSPAGSPAGNMTLDNLKIGSIINTVEKGAIDALWRLGSQGTTSRGDQVMWGLFYASPDDVTWGSRDNPDLFVKIWKDVSGRLDVNFFHVSVPDIEVYSDFPTDGGYDKKGTAIMDNRYIRHEYLW